ncbi:MAG: prolyl oligopeptidase family serine peptidase [Armatimonadetes bacterium]|nr:prolyl oligopeptidase family serine peptidase [Armatimonadota bacterium]
MISGCRTSLVTHPDKPDTPDAQFREFVMSGRRIGDLSPQILSDQTSAGLRIRRIAFVPEDGERAVAVMMSPARPESSRLPVVILQHWLGGTKDAYPLVRVQETLANTGCIVVAMDARYRGERRGNGPDLQEAMIHAFRTGQGHPWLIDTVFDLTRLADLLVTLPDADPERIGIVGLSEGGFEAWMAAVIDRRFSVVIPVVGVTRNDPLVNTTRSHWAFDRVYRAVAKDLGETAVTPRVAHALWSRLLPGYDTKFDPIRLLPTLAPRPLLILAHENDEVVPTAGAKEVYAVVEKRYREAGVPERAQLRIEPGLTHEEQSLTEWIDALAWLNRWLELEADEVE